MSWLDSSPGGLHLRPRSKVKALAMKIGELSKLSGVSASRIRFYELEGVIPRAARTDNGYRDYPADAALLLRFINTAQSLGFSLKEIAAVAPDPYNERPSDALLIASLKRKLVEVEAHIAASLDLKRDILRKTAEIEARQLAAA
jgi:MerR family copper efflux transcriptional regulator